MRVSLDWLREYVDIDVSVEALVERLQGIGLPVDRVGRGGDDAILEIELTTTGPDCMSVRGPAGEGAPRRARPFRAPASGPVKPSPAAPAGVSVEVVDREGCPRFTAQVIEGIRPGPSPAWVQRRLEASGIRPINGVVDVTNYVMLELGQPMHAFDYDRIAGRRLVVRRAEPGERLTTLDGVPRTLDPEILVVGDGERAVALAGIIGGGPTEIGARPAPGPPQAPHRNPPPTAPAGRRLGVRTE